jgi:hypothetical protein
MLTRYKGQLKLKDWAFAIAKRSTMRKARVALARRLGIIMHAMLRDETEFILAQARQSTRQVAEPSSQKERRQREGADDGADFVARGQPVTDCDFNRAALHPAYPIKCRMSTQRTQAPESVDTRRASALDPLENNIEVKRSFHIGTLDVAIGGERPFAAQSILELLVRASLGVATGSTRCATSPCSTSAVAANPARACLRRRQR